MNKSDLEIQKKLVALFIRLENEIKINDSATTKLGWKQRNELISHVYSEYNNHDKLNSARTQWNNSVVKSNVLKWIYNLFIENRDLYGYFEYHEKIIADLNNLKEKAIEKEEYEIADILNEWLLKLP
ncbi:hypothetical protein [Aequorivita antarctica]|uniref:Uncharacterized protein n=1 Tax=Aequorivita antarctica TaxID=153266 RepID=A0A5C6Z341_9FLAO|nr:hypothetical protein [Aequorivita antarctica]TXD73920.1 hypothetical protein ESU54_05470 [Aequorivita antarctica]SRX73360.1 hypothetical protein AEQU3_00796 [Aequorivita antarctica]